MADQNKESKKSRLDVEQTIGILNKIAKDINSQEESSEDLVIACSPVDKQDNEKCRIIKKYDDIKEEYGLSIEVAERLDVKNASTDKKFIIRISDVDKNFVEFDLLKYRDNSSDYEFDQVQFILDQILKIKGALTDELERCAVAITEYIAEIINSKDMYTLLYNNIGWEHIGKETVFKYDRLYSNNKFRKGIFDDELSESIEAYGNADLWFENAQELFENDRLIKDALVLCAGASGVVRQLITNTKETNINMNITGDRASGKSTLQHFVLSFFGNPSEIEGSYVDTINAAEINRVKLSVIPYMLDERLLRYEDISDKRKKVEIMLDIFREYEGKGKERLGGQYKNLSGQRTYGAIISSSVESLMEHLYNSNDFGQFRRFIEIKVSGEETFEDAKLAEEYEKLSKRSYGHGIRRLITYLFENGLNDRDVMDARFDKASAKVLDIIHNFELEKMHIELEDDMRSSASRFALIYLTGELINEAFGWQMDLDLIVEELKNNLMEKLLIVERQQKEVTISTLDNESLSRFLKVLGGEEQCFTKNKNDFVDNKDKYLGYYEINSDEAKIYFRDQNAKALSILGVKAEEQAKTKATTEQKEQAEKFIRLYSKYFEAPEKRESLSYNDEQKKQHQQYVYLVTINLKALREDKII